MTTYAGDFLGLPGLRAYWPMNAFDASGNAIDQAGLDLVLTYNGNPGYNVTTQGAGYLDVDGTGDYLSRPDEASLDIVGTETCVASAQRGLTVGGWFWADTTVANAGYIAKYDNTVAGSSFALVQSATDTAVFFIYSGAVSNGVLAANSQVSTGAWHFIVGKWSPSTEHSLFIDTNKTTDTTSIPATINNSTAVLEIGRLPVAAVALNGRVSNCFMCAMALSDTAISNLYNNTKAAYGL